MLTFQFLPFLPFLKARLRATAGAPGTGRETQGAVVNGTVVCKGLAGAELMAREVTPTPKAARAISRTNLPWGTDWIDSGG